MTPLTLDDVRTILSCGELDGKRLPLIEFVDRQAAEIARLTAALEAAHNEIVLCHEKPCFCHYCFEPLQNAWHGYCECQWEEGRRRLIAIHPACRFHQTEGDDSTNGTGRHARSTSGPEATSSQGTDPGVMRGDKP